MSHPRTITDAAAAPFLSPPGSGRRARIQSRGAPRWAGALMATQLVAGSLVACLPGNAQQASRGPGAGDPAAQAPRRDPAAVAPAAPQPVAPAAPGAPAPAAPAAPGRAVVLAAGLPAASAALDQARVRLIDGDYRKAYDEFAAIQSAYPGTPEAAEAQLRMGQAALIDDDFIKAEDALRRFLVANPGHPLQGTALLLLGRALEGRSDGGAAAFSYRQYMDSAEPGLGDLLHLRTAGIYFDAGRAGDAWNELSLAAQDAERSGSSSAKSRVYEALAARYQEAGNRAQAASALQVALGSSIAAKRPARDLAELAWRLVGAHQAAGNRDAATALRWRIVNTWPTTLQALQAVNDLGAPNVPAWQRGHIYYSNRRWQPAVDALTGYINGGAPDGHLAQARYERAVALTRLGDDDALAALDRVADLHGDSEWAPDALWEAGSLLLRKGDKPAAAARFERLAVAYPKAEQQGQALYWLGKLLTDLGNPTNGRRYTEAAAVAGYEDFYTFRARAALRRPAPVPKSLDGQEQITAEERAAWQEWLAGHGRSQDDQAARRDQAERDPRFARGVALLDAGFEREAEQEFRELLEAYDNDPVVVEDVALACRDRGFYSFSVTLGHRLLDTVAAMGETSLLNGPRVVQKLVLPLAFLKLVLPAAEANKLDPLLMLGMMKQESWFQPRVASSAQARGLTQFIYDTAKTVADELKWPDWTWDDMQRPYVSVPFGAHYLSGLIRDFRGNYYFALAGYNGGPGNVLRWAKGDWNRDVDLFVEEIGYFETRSYVKAVTGNYELYKAIYYK